MLADSNIKPDFDKEIIDIAEYVCHKEITSQEAYQTALLCLMDSIGCGLLALRFPECIKLLGPIVPAQTYCGCKVPGTQFELDPVQAAFNIGATIRWLDYNDTWLAAEWGHPSDNLGGILAVADYVSQQRLSQGSSSLTMHDVLTAMIKAYEIQGILALENSFNRVGLDHVVLVKVATTAVATHLLGGDLNTICNALSLAWVDGQSMRTYRHAPNTGTRKCWAAGDATSRGVRLAMLAMRGEMGYPSVLSAPKWGFYAVHFEGKPFKFSREYDSYVMENILFKVSYPAEFHGQTAVECALKLHDDVKDRLHDIAKILIKTQESAIRIINKIGPLYNASDRDHCLQYMVAVALIYGELTSDHYEDHFAKDNRIDQLRDKMQVMEAPEFTSDYLHPDKRSIANAIQIFFSDGSSTEEVVIEYPVGHKRRRDEAKPLLEKKFKKNASTRFPCERVEKIEALFNNLSTFKELSVVDFMSRLVI